MNNFRDKFLLINLVENVRTVSGTFSWGISEIIFGTISWAVSMTILGIILWAISGSISWTIFGDTFRDNYLIFVIK